MKLRLLARYQASSKNLSFSYRTQHLLAVLFISLSLLLFFSTPILNPTKTYGSDILSVVPLLAPPQFPPGYFIKNNEISDSVTFFHPFLRFYRDQLFKGNFPLWNPYIGTGAPAFGNSSSGLLALPNVAFYLLPWRLALVVSAFVKLFLSGFFTYLFLRQLKLNFGPSLIGALGFMYCGFNIFWLANSAPAVTPTLPMALYFIERTLQSEKLANRLGWGSAISVSLALGIFAGHAETFFYISLFLAFYCLVRVLLLYGNWKIRLVRLLQLATFGLAGIILAAVQLLPFLEYFQRSYASQARVNFRTPFMPPPLWLLNVFPNIFGSTTDSFSAWNSLIQRKPEAFINIEANGAYVGWLGLFLALLALFYVRDYPLAGLFIGGTLVVYSYLYNLFGLAELIHHLPLFNQAQNNRSQPLIAFCIAVSAAFGLQGLSTHKLNWRWQTGLIAAGSGLLALATFFAAKAWEFAQIDQSSPQFTNYMPGQMSYIVVSSMVGLLGLVLLGYWRNAAWVRPVGLALVALVVFAQSGWLLHDYNPTVPDDLYLPQPARIQMLQKQVGENYLVSLEDIALPPDVNTTYHLRTASIYDALGSRTYYKLFRTIAGATPQPYYPKNFDVYLSKLLGMNYVVTTTNLDTSTNQFKLAGSETGVNLYHYLDSPGRYWTVGQAISVADQDKALDVLAQQRPDPTKTVVLEQPALSGLTNESGTVEVVSDKPGEVILHFTRQSKGYLVAAISNFPGWQARLNGEEVALLRANYNFMAVAVPEGTNEIKLYYDPFSFKLGLAISLVTLFGLVVAYLLARWRSSKPVSSEIFERSELSRVK